MQKKAHPVGMGLFAFLEGARVDDELGRVLYRALCNTPCGCCYRWHAGEQTLVSKCQRCRALESYERTTGTTIRHWVTLPKVSPTDA